MEINEATGEVLETPDDKLCWHPKTIEDVSWILKTIRNKEVLADSLEIRAKAHLDTEKAEANRLRGSGAFQWERYYDDVLKVVRDAFKAWRKEPKNKDLRLPGMTPKGWVLPGGKIAVVDTPVTYEVIDHEAAIQYCVVKRPDLVRLSVSTEGFRLQDLTNLDTIRSAVDGLLAAVQDGQVIASYSVDEKALLVSVEHCGEGAWEQDPSAASPDARRWSGLILDMVVVEPVSSFIVARPAEELAAIKIVRGAA